LWPLFSLEISGGASSRRQARLVQGGAIALGIASLLSILTVFASPSWAWLNLACIVATQCFGYAIMAGNYRRADALTRNRIKIVLLAFGFLLASVFLAFLVGTLTGRSLQTPTQTPWVLVPAAATQAALMLLAYAVLRQKLFDLNFALNRTVVYGVVSFILLAGFGLAEWAVEHLIPEAWHEGGPFISAAIALALFLSFHRLRDWVERHVERLLFNSWHSNEKALRRFVAAAGHFDQAQSLCRAFAEEIRRFAQDAEAALYLRLQSDAYRLCAGKLAGARRDYADDDWAFALMRAERAPVKLAQAHSSLPGVLTLPMLDQGTLTGFALLACKPDGTDYRPDEVELLGWAAHQVGLALQAQHAHELEERLSGLTAQVASLTEERDRLSALLAGQIKPRRSRA
jgi:hypothetical protein